MTTQEGHHVHDDADDIEDTVLRPRSTRPSAGPDGLVGRLPGDDDPLGDTVVRGPRHAQAGVPDSRDGSLDDTVVRAPRPVGSPETGHVPWTPPGADPAGGLTDVASGLPSVPEPVRTRVPSIRIGDRVIRLDHPVVVGRRPALPRIVRGPVPELVAVRSPSGLVSSSHLLLHAEGEVAVVDDLRSTNGTLVRPAGAPAYRMPSGASIVALTGTVVEIGDGVAIEILSPHLRATPPPDGVPPSSHQPPVTR
ncbi:MULTISPECIES: hypothetical protein [unclassified Curtobacterium]|uniref:hypothetical protein n=1 Tax=unclassified Curtobacterium TaxID=257496 RepID=UPI00380B2F49